MCICMYPFIRTLLAYDAALGVNALVLSFFPARKRKMASTAGLLHYSQFS